MAVINPAEASVMDRSQEFVGHAPNAAEKAILGFFVVVPLTAVLVGIPIALANGWVRWLDIAMLVILYFVGVHGITIGYHRMFTHGAFHAGPKVRAVLALAGSLAIEGRVIDWVADHRKHHQFSDKDGDPHSPWEYGPGGQGPRARAHSRARGMDLHL